MTRLLFLVLLSLPAVAADSAAMERRLDEIARTATAMVDGDICQRILTARAIVFLSKRDPRDPWVDADNYDVVDAAFIATKKTLMRLGTLADFPADVNLWLPLPNVANRIHIAIRNRNELSQFWQWGNLTQEMPADMRGVLDTGQRLTVRGKGGLISVLAPVKNSLDEIVGLVEVVARIVPDLRENVK